jgi:LytS/YehU family sensor histidine kinase
MLIIGPVVGALFGVIAGLFAFVGAKIARSREPKTSAD